MNARIFRKWTQRFGMAGLIVAGLLTMPVSAPATTDDARSFAIEAAIPWLDLKKNPYHLRETWWAQDTKTGEAKLIRHQLFARNDYWFWAATADMKGKISIHVYDEKGKLVDSESFQKGHTAGVRITPKKSGVYFLRIVVESAPGGKAHWAVVYGYR